MPEIEIATREQVTNIGEKSGFEIPIVPYKGFEMGYYLGSGTWPSDDYRSSYFPINDRSPNEYRHWLWKCGVKDICENPKRFKRNFKQIYPNCSGDGFKNIIILLVNKLDEQDKLLLICDHEKDIQSAEVFKNCLLYLYKNDFGIEIPF